MKKITNAYSLTNEERILLNTLVYREIRRIENEGGNYDDLSSKDKKTYDLLVDINRVL